MCYLPFQNLSQNNSRFDTFARFRNGLAVSEQPTILLAVLIPHQFDIIGQVCFVAFKCNSSNTIKTSMFIRTAFGLL